jgi:hypothetical protein
LPDENCLTNLRTYLTERKDKVFTVKSTSPAAKDFFKKTFGSRKFASQNQGLYLGALAQTPRNIWQNAIIIRKI